MKSVWSDGVLAEEKKEKKRRRRREGEEEQCQIQEYKIFEKTKNLKIISSFQTTH